MLMEGKKKKTNKILVKELAKKKTNKTIKKLSKNKNGALD